MAGITLYDYQKDALERMKIGCILCGGVGSGKSRTSLAFYYELVRHRIASFAQESTRYCNYSKEKFGGELTFIWPSYIRGEQYCELNDSEVTIKSSFLEAMTYAEKDYKLMIANGMRPEQARCVLPLCLKTEIVVTANYREWRNIFKLRTPVAAHPQMRELMCPLLKELQSKIPVVFDDIYTYWPEDDQTGKGSMVK